MLDAKDWESRVRIFHVEDNYFSSRFALEMPFKKENREETRNRVFAFDLTHSSL